jgi:ParB-like chromosome segregation protein Spo0J
VNARKATEVTEASETRPRIHTQLAELVVPIEELRQFKGNPNVGDVALIRRSLRRFGQYKPITVNIGTLTGRPNEILAGNHTWQAARQEGWPDIARTLIDVDQEEAVGIVAADNRIAELAKRDPEMLAEMLGGMDDLTATGYSEEDLAKLVGDQSVDEGGDDEEDPVWGVIITCRDEAQQLDLLEKLDAEGLDVRAMVR